MIPATIRIVTQFLSKNNAREMEKRKMLTREYVERHRAWRHKLNLILKTKKKPLTIPRQLSRLAKKSSITQNISSCKPFSPLSSTQLRQVNDRPSSTPQFSIARTTRRQYARSYTNSDAVRSEEEFERILEQLRAEEDKNPEMRFLKTLAKIPDIILDPTQRSAKFNNENRLISDPIASQRAYKCSKYWTKPQTALFVENFKVFGKKFRKIAFLIPHKTVNDCVEFYYCNKHTLKLKKIYNSPQYRKRRTSLKVSPVLSFNLGIEKRLPRGIMGIIGNENEKRRKIEEKTPGPSDPVSGRSISLRSSACIQNVSHHPTPLTEYLTPTTFDQKHDQTSISPHPLVSPGNSLFFSANSSFSSNLSSPSSGCIRKFTSFSTQTQFLSQSDQEILSFDYTQLPFTLTTSLSSILSSTVEQVVSTPFSISSPFKSRPPLPYFPNATNSSHILSFLPSISCSKLISAPEKKKNNFLKNLFDLSTVTTPISTFSTSSQLSSSHFSSLILDSSSNPNSFLPYDTSLHFPTHVFAHPIKTSSNTNIDLVSDRGTTLFCGNGDRSNIIPVSQHTLPHEHNSNPVSDQAHVSISLQIPLSNHQTEDSQESAHHTIVRSEPNGYVSKSSLPQEFDV